MKRFSKQIKEWEKWANRQLKEKIYKKFIKDMKFGKKALGQIENRIYQESNGFDKNSLTIMSVWMFFNVLTWYITYKAVSLNHRVDMEKRLRTAMVHLRGR